MANSPKRRDPDAGIHAPRPFIHFNSASFLAQPPLTTFPPHCCVARVLLASKPPSMCTMDL